MGRLLSQLAHVELITPKPDESLKFFTDVMGLIETARQGNSVYLRGWGSHLHHELVLSEGPAPALGHIGWRAAGPYELEVAVERLETGGAGVGWYTETPGHGPAFRFRNPGGHLQESFWETERFQPPAELAPNYPNRPQRYAPRGIAARTLDHVTVTSANIMDNFHWYRDTLGFRFMEWTVLDEHPDMPIFGMLTTCERAHDLGMVADFSSIPGGCTTCRSGSTRSATCCAPPTFCSNPARASNTGPAATAWASRRFCISASRAACGSSSIPAATATTCRTGRR